MTEIKIENFGGSKRLVITWGKYQYHFKEGDVEYLVDILGEKITGIVIENFKEKERKIVEAFKEEVKKIKRNYEHFKFLGLIDEEQRQK